MKDNLQSALDNEKKYSLDLNDYKEKDAVIEDQIKTIISLKNKIKELESIITAVNKEQSVYSNKNIRVVERNQSSSSNSDEEIASEPPLIFDIDNSKITKNGSLDISGLGKNGKLVQKEKFTHYYEKDILIVSINIPRAVMDEAAPFKKYLNQIMVENQKIIIDFTSCYFFDSTFLGVLVNFLKKTVNCDGDIRLVMGEETKSIIFHVVNMDKVFKTFENIEDAITSYE